MEPSTATADESGLTLDRRRSFDNLFSLVYEELWRIAKSVRRAESHSTLLGPTALVHEAWLRLKDSPQLGSTSPLHFKHIAAGVFRRVLVDAARERNAQKRGGRDAIRVTMDESLKEFEDLTLELIEVDELLKQLAEIDSRQAHIAELRIFSELTNPEIASEIGISLSGVERDWRVAKAWLKARIVANQAPASGSES
jgi:RNA polymerase sigma factor (TIGR02999 family)